MTLNPFGHRGKLTRTGIVGIVFILVLGVIFATLVSLSVTPIEPKTFKPECENQLGASIGYSVNGPCLESINISVHASNSSEDDVPVIFMRPGTNATMSFLYHNVLPSLIVPSEQVKQVPPNLTAAEVPYALSVPTGEISKNGVVFSNATLIFQNESWILYSYTLSASSNSSGYYAILPPYYYGTYPALLVGTNTDALNLTELSIWAYDGPSISTEHTIPSNIVGTSNNLIILNVTVPAISYCPNPACVLISHSGY